MKSQNFNYGMELTFFLILRNSPHSKIIFILINNKKGKLSVSRDNNKHWQFKT